MNILLLDMPATAQAEPVAYSRDETAGAPVEERSLAMAALS